jgi:hypothetical protein
MNVFKKLRGGQKMEQEPVQRQLKLQIDPKEGEGIYSNLAMIAHSPSEFILDFARVMPGLPQAKVMARIIMTPTHAMILKRALEENIQKYEGRFGEIKLHGAEHKKMGFIGGLEPEGK